METKERTLYCGNLSDRVTEDTLYELFLQAGPLENVSIPKDKDGRKRNFGFVTFKHAVSVQYSVALMNGITLYGKPLKLDARTGTETEPNPYLEILYNHRNCVSYPEKYDRRYVDKGDSRGYMERRDSRGYMENSDRNYGYDRRDSFIGDRGDRYGFERMMSAPVPILFPEGQLSNVISGSEQYQRTPHRGSANYRSKGEPSPWTRHRYY